jgi:chromate reductase
VQFTERDGLKLLPPFDEDDKPPRRLRSRTGVTPSRRATRSCSFATPEYNSSIPGQLKNNKPVAVIGASAYGALSAQAELRKVLAAAGARVIDRELPVASAHDAFEDDATLKDRDVVLELDGILVELLYSAQQGRVA